MKDSIGSIPSLALVFTFIIIISGYLAFSVNYSKAFKMKSKIIDVLQKEENLTSNRAKNSIREEITSYSQLIGYSASTNFTAKECNRSEGWNNDLGEGWCYKIVDENATSMDMRYIKVKTFVSIDVPIINRVLPNLRFFMLEGSTKTTKKLND